MSQEFQIEVRFKPEAQQIKPTPAELALIHAVLPDLIQLLHELDEQAEAE